MIIFVQSFLCKFVHICLLILITKNLSLVYMLKAEADVSLHCQRLNFMYFDHICSKELSSTKSNSILTIFKLWKC